MVKVSSSKTFLFLAIVFATILFDGQASHVTLNNGGFENVVIAFAADTKEAEGEALIPRIKELFIDASKALYEATRQRSYFKDVTILVPHTWTRKPDYVRSTFENFADADIRIDTPNPRYGDGPYTLQALPCGYPGLFIHLTPNYLKYLFGNSTSTFGNPGKTLVHEWAHLRYGIFDEFGFQNDNNFPISYFDLNYEEVRPNACANKMLIGQYWNHQKNTKCTAEESLTNKECIFIPDPQNNDATSSIASYHFLPNVDQFCDNTTKHKHNPIAPNKHNLLCNSQSTWDVITEHEDFKRNKNPPTAFSNIVPNFKIAQQMEETFSLVLDISGSMNKPIDFSKLQMLLDVTTRWIREEVRLGSAVGIVTFSSKTDYKGIMRKILTDADREQITREIPNSAYGTTCIGCGLISGKEQLNQYRGSLGGTIILVTDGEENQIPYIKDVQQQIIDAKIRVITIAFTEAASNNIEQLASATGGKAYFVPLSAGIQGLGSAFFDALTVQSVDAERPVKVSDEIYNTDGDKFHHGSFTIDSTLGNNTVVSFIYKQENDISNIILNGPRVNVALSDTSGIVVINKVQKSIQFRFPLLQPGNYEYTISRNGVSNQEIVVTVTSKAFGNGVKPITTKCWTHLEKRNGNTVLAIFAEVKQGNNPVIKAIVMAEVERPNGKKPKLIQLLDNGNGAPDITRDDGIYSHYFTAFSGKGRYVVKAQVAGDGKTSIQEAGFIASQSMPIVNKYMANIKVSIKPTGEFERTASGGAINLDEDINTENNDLYPPSKIQDLRVTNITSGNKKFEVELSWTAPGDDFDSGTASGYVIRYSRNWEELFKQFLGMDVPVIKNPSPSGTDESITITIPGAKEKETYFFAIRAYDKVNQASPTSNIAQGTFLKPPKKSFLEWLLDQIKEGIDSILNHVFGKNSGIRKSTSFVVTNLE